MDKQKKKIIKFSIRLLILTICFIVLTFYCYKVYLFNAEKSEFADTDIVEKNILSNLTKNRISVKINPLTDFNYKSKSEIYAVREKFVQQSIFKNKNYKPNEEVFGDMATGMPWVSIMYQNYETDRKHPHFGLSEESRFINNPSGLVMLNMDADILVNEKIVSAANVSATTTKDIKNSMLLLPESITYIKNKNTVLIKYSINTFFYSLKDTVKNNRQYYKVFCLDCLNARDFGYNWIFAYDSKNISFNENSVKDKAVELKNKIALVKYENEEYGVNNSIMNSKELFFGIISLPASINLKLWKNKPNDVYTDKASINVELLLLE